jgi:hypothetical protein
MTQVVFVLQECKIQSVLFNKNIYGLCTVFGSALRLCKQRCADMATGSSHSSGETDFNSAVGSEVQDSHSCVESRGREITVRDILSLS